jgi:hypothetical protein
MSCKCMGAVRTKYDVIDELANFTGNSWPVFTRHAHEHGYTQLHASSYGDAQSSSLVGTSAL